MAASLQILKKQNTYSYEYKLTFSLTETWGILSICGNSISALQTLTNFLSVQFYLKILKPSNTHLSNSHVFLLVDARVNIPFLLLAQFIRFSLELSK
jgi:hypothetical protein